jgi:tripartite-type tricarboxylate transporter receptor subunit TctC
MGPANLPREVVARLNAEIKKALADPDVNAKLSAQALDPMPTTPEEFAAHLKSEFDRMKDVIKLSGARIE